MRVTAIEGHQIWARSYDAGPNPLLALESRHLLARFGPLDGLRFLDIACGTGRWMQLAEQRGARVFGVDFSPEMLREASRKSGLRGRLSFSDACRLPVRDNAADLTLCSFALGYLPSTLHAIGEMARVTRRGGRVTVSDLHPSGLAAGWTRSFRSDSRVYQIDHHCHTVAAWEAAAAAAGLVFDWRLDACFDEPEREIFRQAGKDSSFLEVSRIPALLAISWTKP